MGRTFARAGRLFLTAAMIGVAGSCTLSVAGDDDDLADDAPNVADQNRRQVNASAISDNVERWIYYRNLEGGEPQQILDSLLAAKVKQIAQIAVITGAHKQKLLLAGKGDIHRLFDRIDQIKAKYRTGMADADVWKEAFQEARPLRSAFEGGLFGGDSLFAKTVHKLLTPEEVDSYARIELDRRRFRHRAGVHMTVLRLATALGLSDEQWKRLEQLLLKETHPARIPGRPFPAAYFNVVYVQMGRLPEEKLKPLFEPWQWRALKSKLEQAALFARGLRNNGISFDGDEEPRPQPRLAPGAAAGNGLF